VTSTGEVHATDPSRSRNNMRKRRVSYLHIPTIFEVLGNGLSWVNDSALCSQADPELFHADKADTGFTQAAKAICRDCPLKEPCLTWAMETRQEYGVWGGLAPQDRKRLRSKRRAA